MSIPLSLLSLHCRGPVNRSVWDLDWFVSFCLVRISTWITHPWRQLSCSCLTQLDSKILEMELKGLLSWTELSLCVGVDFMLIAFWCHSSLNICLCGCLCCLSSASASVSLFEFLVNLSSAVSVSKSFSKFPRFVLDRNSDSGNFGLWKYAVFPCFLTFFPLETPRRYARYAFVGVCRHNDNEVWLLWYCSTECTLQL